MKKYERRPMVITENNVEKYYCTQCKIYHLKEEMYINPTGIKRRDLRCINSTKKRAKDYRDSNMNKVLLANAKKRSIIKNIEFNLTIEDIIIPEYCPILNIPIKIGASMEERDNSPSLDRVNNDLGYIKGNVKVISNLANSMKRNLSKELLEVFSKNIMDYMT